MPTPGEHKTVQARILAYAQEIGWTLVSRAEAERRRDFDAEASTAEERARRASLYFGDLLHGQLRAFNPLYQEAEGAGIGQWQRLHFISSICPASASIAPPTLRKWRKEYHAPLKEVFCGAKTDFAPL